MIPWLVSGAWKGSGWSRLSKGLPEEMHPGTSLTATPN